MHIKNSQIKHCYNPCLYYPIDTYKKMAERVDEKIPENLFINMIIEKANIIKDHLNKSMHPLIIVANIGPTIAVFKFYDMTEEHDSLELHMTLSYLGDIDEQIHVLWQQVNFLLQQYCSQCENHDSSESNVNQTSNGQ